MKIEIIDEHGRVVAVVPCTPDTVTLKGEPVYHWKWPDLPPGTYYNGRMIEDDE